MANYQNIYIDMSAAELSSPWFRLLQTNSQNDRMITGALTSGDSLVIRFSNEKLGGGQRDLMQMPAATTAATYADSPSQASVNFDLGYSGSPAWVKVVKTGTNGSARVVLEA